MNKNLTLLSELKILEADRQLILLVTFLMKIGQFMALPFIAIFLTKNSHATAEVIGLILGIGPLMYGLSGLPTGLLVDKIGAKNAIIISLIICGITSYLFFYSFSLTYIFIINAINGFSRTLFDVSAKSYGAYNIDVKIRKIYFGWRFIAVNAAGGLGPALGGYFASINSTFSFELTGIIYLMISVIIFFLLAAETHHLSDNSKQSLDIKLIIRDSSLAKLFCVSFIMWVTYSQLDSTLPQYLNAHLSHGIKFYSYLLIVNAVFCAILQRWLAKKTDDYSEISIAVISMVSFAIGYFIFALSLNMILLTLAMIFIVIGESIALPLNDILLARISSTKNIGSYYGIITVAMLGLGFGPMLGGIIYQHFGALSLFLICALASLFSIGIYKTLLIKI